jgi:hypothetical protein
VAARKLLNGPIVDGRLREVLETYNSFTSLSRWKSLLVFPVPARPTIFAAEISHERLSKPHGLSRSAHEPLPSAFYLLHGLLSHGVRQRSGAPLLRYRDVLRLCDERLSA